MRASGDKVARPFQEVGMVLQKFYRGQRHFRSSTSKFVENPRKGRKFSTQRICTGRWCKCVAKLHHQCGKPKIFRVLNVWPTNLLIGSLMRLTTILTRGNEKRWDAKDNVAREIFTFLIPAMKSSPARDDSVETWFMVYLWESQVDLLLFLQDHLIIWMLCLW